MTFCYTTLEFLWQTAYTDHIVVGISHYPTFNHLLHIITINVLLISFTRILIFFFLCTIPVLSWHLKQSKLLTHPTLPKGEHLIGNTYSSYSHAKYKNQLNEMPTKYASTIGRGYDVCWQMH